MIKIEIPKVPELPKNYIQNEPVCFISQLECYEADLCRWSEFTGQSTSSIKIAGDSMSTYDESMKMHRLENITYNDDGSVKDRKVGWHK